jgi:DNA sulfur modification protein DndD
MRITNIDIKNYRQYQSLSFAFPESKSSDIHIVVAQNGVGKTNLLNAITWCLYDKEPHLGDDNKNFGLPKINLTAIEEAKAAGKDTEYVEVEIRAQDGTEYITYKRSLPFRITSSEPFEETAKEKFTVTVATAAGNPKVHEDKDEVKLLVNKYMPEKIREYFYFDGEQLNNYFISSRKGNVKDAIFNISQVDIVNLIYKRIGDLISDKQKEAAAKAPNIKKIKDELDEAEKQIEVIEKQIKAHEDQIATSDRIIKENTEYLQGEENLPELEKQWQELRTTQKSLEDEKADLMESMYSFVRDMKISLTFYPAAKNTLALIEEKEKAKALPPNIDKALLHKALLEHTCTVCNQHLSEHDEEFIQKLIDSFQVSSATSNLLMGIRSELERIVKTADRYSAEKKKLADKFQRLEKQLREVEVELGDVDKRINRISNKDEVKRRHTERQENEELKKINIEKLGVAKDRLTKAREEKEKLGKDLEKSLAKDAECSRIRQLINFATKGRSVIGSVEKDMMDEVRKKMEERTTYYFMKLIWKQNTYDRIVLNEEFQLDLIHKEGYSCVGTCSAAERCLLALSFTLALHEVSGFNSLLFIDTPVARVSDINRVNFANVLCEVSANKQIIMTFSPDEYSLEIKKIFDPAARTNVGLQMLDEKITVVK